jgi:tight adherence protein C
LGLNAALQRVAQELAVSSPVLAEEMALVNAQVRAGVDRVDALKDLADRTGLVDIRGLVSMLAQSMRFGVSIAETLRVYAEEFRDKRMQRAEEKAAMVGTKMIFPLVLCMFPAFFVVAIGPAVLGVLNVIRGL